MIKDNSLRLLFIPLLGLVISFVSGIITYSKYSATELVCGLLYFVFVSYCIWRGCQWIHLQLRRLFTVNQNPFYKISFVCTVSGLYGICISGMLGLIWMRISKENFRWDEMVKFILFSFLAVIVFTLVYEVLYLNKEREIDTKTVAQLDQELTRAEMMALRNEMDPHFIFNSLSTLSNLIHDDAIKADLFNEKLAGVYKYFLINKEKELIPLNEELALIKDYFFLLQIRHDDKLQLHLSFEEDAASFLIIPGALQILVENAIKHNSFTADHPLFIKISKNEEYIVVENTSNGRNISSESTKIGLKNLGAQYQLLTKQGIRVADDGIHFKVLLPLIKKDQL